MSKLIFENWRKFLTEEVDENDPRLAAQKKRHEEEAAAADQSNKEKLDRMKAAQGKSPAEILLAGYGGDPDKMPENIRMAYDKLKAADEKADQADAALDAAEDKSDATMAQAAKDPKLSQHEELMAKGKLFMAAVDYVSEKIHPMQQEELNNVALAMGKGDMNAAQQHMQKAQQMLQFLMWFNQITKKATVAGWQDQGASWDDVIEKAKQLGFQG